MEISKSAFRVLTVLWDYGSMDAKEIAKIMNSKFGWNKNTTYTVLNRCIKEGYIEREDPNFVCKALITKEQVRADKLKNMIGDIFENSPKVLFSSLIQSNVLSQEDIRELRAIIDKMQ